MEENSVDDRTINNDVTMRGGDASTLAVIDQYEVIRKLGGGGFGSVYLAKDSVSGIEVAIKGLPPVVKNSTEELERIRENFALVARLHHPNIAAALHLHLVRNAEYRQVGVYEDLRVEPGDTLMVMEYAPGVTLNQWRKQFPEGRVPLPNAVAIVWQIAQALDYAHASHIIHRDIKPSNIMVETREAGEPVARVLDFGLAAEIRSSMGRVSLEVRSTSGTRPYMAPEQWAGQKQGSATDQYALAVLFCELVTGEVPFASVFETGDPMIMMTAVCNRPVELPKECPRRHALERALEKDPSIRFPSCMDFIENLAKSEARYDAESGLTSDGQSSSPQVVAAGTGKDSVKSQRWPAKAILVGGMAFAAVAVIATTFFLLSRPASVPSSAASEALTPDAEPARMETTPPQQKEKRPEAQVAVRPKDSIPERISSAIVPVTAPRGGSVLSGTQKESSVRLGPDKAYRVVNRYIIPENAELLIEEGTSLAFGAGAGLIVQGKLVVSGSENERVLFVGESAGRELWDGIKIFGYKGSVISCAKFSGAKVAVELSKAGVSIANAEFVGNGKALHTSGHYGKGSTLENCLIANNTEGVTFHHAALDFCNCSILDNEKGGVVGSYYGDIKLVDCVVSGNGKGIIDGGYDGAAAAHGCAIFNNREFDVDCRSSKAGDFTGNWWGEKTTEILKREGDGVKLPNIKGNFVNIADFLIARPSDCGAKLSVSGLERGVIVEKECNAKKLREERMTKTRAAAKSVNAKVTKNALSDDEIQKMLNMGYKSRASGQLATSDAQLGYSLIKMAFENVWDRPAWSDSLRPMTLRVWFGDGGRVVKYKLESSSGDQKADSSILSAAKRVSSIAGLPNAFIEKYRSSGVPIRFTVKPN